METMRCNDLKKGMRVILTNPSEHYDIGKSNPSVGSKWECVGTVLSYSMGSVQILWDNGASNCYVDKELSLDNGIIGRCRSIWD